jgi:hypothetical protein
MTRLLTMTLFIAAAVLVARACGMTWSDIDHTALWMLMGFVMMGGRQ